VIAAFEKSPRQLLSNKLHTLLKDESIGIIDTHSLDLSIDETLYDLISMIEKNVGNAGSHRFFVGV
jgi:circadian clock protein KaiC